MPDGTPQAQPQGQPQSQTLAQTVRAKYPGAYNDMTDQQLETSILAKYPQYGDFPRTKAIGQSGQTGKPSLMQRVGSWWNTPEPVPVGSESKSVASGAMARPSYSPKEDIEKGLPEAAGITALALSPEISTPAALLKGVARGAIGSAVGGAGGAWLGRYGGEAFGNPKLGEEIGGTVGGLAGGMYGGLDKPILGPWGHEYSIGKMIPFLGRQGTREEAEQKSLGAFMSKGYKNVGEPEMQSDIQPAGLSKGTVSRMKGYGSYDPFAETSSYSGKGITSPLGATKKAAGASLQRSRMGRTWSAGDLASMPRPQLAGEYAKEMAKPPEMRDQEWLAALKAESGRNTAAMYSASPSSVKGGPGNPQ